MTKRRFGVGTHVGNVREHNEDSYFADSGLGLWLVADGMGGRQAGEVASKIVRDSIVSNIRQNGILKQAVKHAHQAVIAALSGNKDLNGMGSTVVALKMDGNDYEIAWVGDSRAYLWNKISLTPLTRDHTVAQGLLDAGIIDAKEAEQHPQRNRLIQALGIIEITKLNIATVTGRLAPGERILLCSDGLTGELGESRIAAILKENIDVQDAVDQLIRATLKHEGKDNITVLLIPAMAVATTDVTGIEPPSDSAVMATTQPIEAQTQPTETQNQSDHPVQTTPAPRVAKSNILRIAFQLIFLFSLLIVAGWLLWFKA